MTDGNIFGLGDPSGAGKPLVLNAISDLCKEQAGSIEVAGKDVKPVHPLDQLSGVRIAFLSQVNSIIEEIMANRNLRLFGRPHKQPLVISTAAEPVLVCNPPLGGVCAAAGRSTRS